MGSHNMNVAQQLLRSQPGHQRAAAEHAEQSEGSEEVQWTGKITQQEANRDEIEENAEGACNAVMRDAALAVHVANRHFANRRAIPRGQSRNETVQFAVERNLLQDLATIRFECSSKVVNVDAAQLVHQPVPDARGNSPHPEV